MITGKIPVFVLNFILFVSFKVNQAKRLFIAKLQMNEMKMKSMKWTNTLFTRARRPTNSDVWQHRASLAMFDVCLMIVYGNTTETSKTKTNSFIHYMFNTMGSAKIKNNVTFLVPNIISYILYGISIWFWLKIIK